MLPSFQKKNNLKVLRGLAFSESVCLYKSPKSYYLCFFVFFLLLPPLKSSLGTVDLGQVYYEPLKDRQGNVLLVTLKAFPNTPRWESITCYLRNALLISRVWLTKAALKHRAYIFFKNKFRGIPDLLSSFGDKNASALTVYLIFFFCGCAFEFRFMWRFTLLCKKGLKKPKKNESCCCRSVCKISNLHLKSALSSQIYKDLFRLCL